MSHLGIDLLSGGSDGSLSLWNLSPADASVTLSWRHNGALLCLVCTCLCARPFDEVRCFVRLLIGFGKTWVADGERIPNKH